jgi:hypothetical protein
MWNGHYFKKTIYYNRSSDGVKMSSLGVLLQVTKQAAGQVDTMRDDIAKMWKKVSTHGGVPLVGKHLVPFGKSGDMGGNITTHIIHRHNAMLKSTKQRVLTNLNDIDTVIEMETPAMANFSTPVCSRSPKHFYPTRMTMESRFLVVLRRHKQVAPIVSSSMKTTIEPWT